LQRSIAICTFECTTFSRRLPDTLFHLFLRSSVRLAYSCSLLSFRNRISFVQHVPKPNMIPSRDIMAPPEHSIPVPSNRDLSQIYDRKDSLSYSSSGSPNEWKVDLTVKGIDCDGSWAEGWSELGKGRKVEAKASCESTI